MRRIKYLKSIDKYLDETQFFNLLNDNNYVTPIRRRYKSNIDISKTICSLRTFSDEEIAKIQEYCEKNNIKLTQVKKLVSMIFIIL